MPSWRGSKPPTLLLNWLAGNLTDPSPLPDFFGEEVDDSDGRTSHPRHSVTHAKVYWPKIHALRNALEGVDMDPKKAKQGQS